MIDNENIAAVVVLGPKWSYLIQQDQETASSTYFLQVLIIHEDSEENRHLKGGSEIRPLLPSVPRILLPTFLFFSRPALTFGMVFIFSHSVFKVIFRYSPPQVCRKLKIQDIVKKYRRERSVSDFYESLFFFLPMMRTEIYLDL